MRHFLQYWKTYDPENLGTPLDHAASGQFRRLHPGDTLWIVALMQQRLTLLGRLIVGEVVPKRLAIKLLGHRVYDAPLVALAKPGTDRAIIEADIQKLASELRFQSVHDRLSIHDPQRTQQLQSLRELTPKTIKLLRSVLESAQRGQREYPRRVLFARVGWMKWYAGPQTGDEKPVGGGKNNKKNIGHELFNFKNFGGHLYGFVSVADRRINLERIDPTNQGDSLSGVLVVFVAKQRIIGWYGAANVHKTEVTFPSDVSEEIRKRLKQAKTKDFSLERHSFECYFWNRVAASAVRLKVVTGCSVESTAVRASRKSVPRITGWLRSTYHMRSPRRFRCRQVVAVRHDTSELGSGICWTDIGTALDGVPFQHSSALEHSLDSREIANARNLHQEFIALTSI
jgi:hypothetical protein